MKKLMVLLLALCLLTLTACGGSSTTALPESAAEAPAAPAQEGEAAVEESAVQEDEEPAESAPQIEQVAQEYDLMTISRFSEGRAWAQYTESQVSDGHGGVETTIRYALVDEQGRILGHGPAMGTPVTQGYTASCGEDELVILDRDGNVSFRFANTPDDSFEVRGSGDGCFLVLEHVSGFSGNQYLLYLMDHEGNAVSEKADVTDTDIPDPNAVHDPDECAYLGENIYVYPWNGKYVFNGATGACFRLNLDLYPFYEGKTISVDWQSAATITPADLASEEAFASWRENRTTIHADDNSRISEGIFYEYNEGLYYDYDLNPLFPRPDYGENVSINLEGTSGFSGGTAVLALIGADERAYITFIDETGTPQFEPERLGEDGDHWAFSEALSCNGRFFFNLQRVSSETGIGCISADGTRKKYEMPNNSFPNDVDEAYLYFSQSGSRSAYALRLEDGTVIDKAKEFISGGETAAAASETDQDYISPASFDMTGAWKNVGEYGFGQAQPGAIVAFDGTTCNVFSPQDTYALYKDGEDFVLDCTSYLTAKTVSFTVKIVDDDHVDLLYSGDKIELTRVG